MEKFSIAISNDEQVYNFEVADYLHHEDDHCKFEVFLGGDFIASFEPDGHEFLRICKKYGKVNEELLHLIADKLELYQIKNSPEST
jgi:hypothetical protein